MFLTLSPIGGAGWQFFSNNGVPLSGGLIYTYIAGSSTPLATYTTSLGLIANSNPIVLDSAGRPPQEIWLNSAYGYKFVLQDATFNQIFSADNINGFGNGSAGYTTATAGQTVFTVPYYIVGSNSLFIFVNGNKQISTLN